MQAAPPSALHAVGRSCPNLAAAAAQFPCRLLIFTGSGGAPAPKSAAAAAAAAFPRVHKRCEHSVCVCMCVPFVFILPSPSRMNYSCCLAAASDFVFDCWLMNAGVCRGRERVKTWMLCLQRWERAAAARGFKLVRTALPLLSHTPPLLHRSPLPILSFFLYSKWTN